MGSKRATAPPENFQYPKIAPPPPPPKTIGQNMTEHELWNAAVHQRLMELCHQIEARFKRFDQELRDARNTLKNFSDSCAFTKAER